MVVVKEVVALFPLQGRAAIRREFGTVRSRVSDRRCAVNFRAGSAFPCEVFALHLRAFTGASKYFYFDAPAFAGALSSAAARSPSRFSFFPDFRAELVLRAELAFRSDPGSAS